MDINKNIGTASSSKLSIDPCNRCGTATIGDAPSYSLTSRNKGKRYISREHAKTDGQGVHSPAPDTYLPLEQMGITNTTGRAQFGTRSSARNFSDRRWPPLARRGSRPRRSS